MLQLLRDEIAQAMEDKTKALAIERECLMLGATSDLEVISRDGGLPNDTTLLLGRNSLPSTVGGDAPRPAPAPAATLPHRPALTPTPTLTSALIFNLTLIFSLSHTLTFTLIFSLTFHPHQLEMLSDLRNASSSSGQMALSPTKGARPASGHGTLTRCSSGVYPGGGSANNELRGSPGAGSFGAGGGGGGSFGSGGSFGGSFSGGSFSGVILGGGGGGGGAAGRTLNRAATMPALMPALVGSRPASAGYGSSPSSPMPGTPPRDAPRGQTLSAAEAASLEALRQRLAAGCALSAPQLSLFKQLAATAAYRQVQARVTNPHPNPQP